jgi:hypothetical protein
MTLVGDFHAQHSSIGFANSRKRQGDKEDPMNMYVLYLCGCETFISVIDRVGILETSNKSSIVGPRVSWLLIPFRESLQPLTVFYAHLG